MVVNSSRRPIKIRDLAITQKAASWLSKQSITPNQISVLSVVFATLAGLCLLAVPLTLGITRLAVLLFCAVFIQMRLLCNLLDGMVAVEGGKKSRSGELFNDIPDRFADSVILICAGYAITLVDWGGILGWCVALLAVMTAYVRTMAASVGAPVDFQGPMAKQHRMALLTGACLLTVVENMLGFPQYVLLVVMLLMLVGCLVTVYRRIVGAYRYLENQDDL